jgi:glutamine synthetase adenylyltransferase
MPAYREALASELARSADPVQAELGLSRLADASPGSMERVREGGPLLRTVVTVMAASPFLTRTTTTDPLALDVLSALDRPVEPMEPLSRWKDLEVLRIAALDLSGETSLETVGASLADLADGLLGAATTTSCLTADLAVIAMGKLGARELNYGSDIDVVLVGSGDPQPLVNLVGPGGGTPRAQPPAACPAPPTSRSAPKAARARWCAASPPTSPIGTVGRKPGSSRPCSRPGRPPGTPTSGVPSLNRPRYVCGAGPSVRTTYEPSEP